MPQNQEEQFHEYCDSGTLHSKVYPSLQDQNSWTEAGGKAGDAAEISAVDTQIRPRRIPELNLVQRVCCRRADLQIEALRQTHVLLQVQIELVDARADERSQGECAQLA